MRKAVLLIIAFIILLCTINVSAAKEVSFTQEDRDRLRNVELKLERLDEGQKSLQRQMDDIKTFMLWGFGILFGGMGMLLGFVIWDRRTALAPAIKRNKELEDREDKIERALRRYAREDPKLTEILKEEGLLL